MIKIEKEYILQEEKILIECDFKTSKKCKGEYYKVYKNVIKCRNNNNGKDKCIFCFNSSTKFGKDNYNFKYEKDENFFENIDSELKIYLLGWIAGDGTITKDGFKLSIHWVDINILNLFRDSISINSKIKFRKYDNTVNLTINSVKLVKDLLVALELENYGKKSDKIKMPSYLSQKEKWIFLRGLMDSDGFIGSLYSKKKNPICGICSTSNEMIEDIKKLCNIENIKFCHPLNSPNVTFNAQNAIKFMDKIYDNNETDFFLLRKKALYVAWKSWVRGYGTPFNPARGRVNYPFKHLL
jgi:hypothetical protein